jgi:predicted nucleic acid-binding protein
MISKSLVVDTSIFRSAGRTDNPESSRSREILEGILIICHKVVFTPYMYSEWRKHRSNFSSTWLASMTARKKITRRKDEEVRNDQLRYQIDQLSLSDNLGKAIDKDLPFVEAAIATDKTIISKDEKMKEILCVLSKNIKVLKIIAWVSPINEESESISEWLLNGANLDKDRCLG